MSEQFLYLETVCLESFKLNSPASSHLHSARVFLIEGKNGVFEKAWLGYGPEQDSWRNKKECLNPPPST
jgi:hypothetical protein